MSPEQDDSGWTEPKTTAVLVLADGTMLEGFGLGATGRAVGEVCFNTAMTGYEEILTDPSYAGQIITFTFPHIGRAPAASFCTRRSPTPRTSAPHATSTPGSRRAASSACAASTPVP
jgi:hypothetical protein